MIFKSLLIHLKGTSTERNIERELKRDFPHAATCQEPELAPDLPTAENGQGPVTVDICKWASACELSFCPSTLSASQLNNFIHTYVLHINSDLNNLIKLLNIWKWIADGKGIVMLHIISVKSEMMTANCALESIKCIVLFDLKVHVFQNFPSRLFRIYIHIYQSGKRKVVA